MNKKTFTKSIAWVVTFALALAIFPAMPLSVQAESSGATIDMSDDNPSSSGDGWTYASNVYTVADGANVTVTGTASGLRRIVVNGTAAITLDNVSHTVTDNSPAILLNNGAVLTLTLAADSSNFVTGGGNDAGIGVSEGTKITINGTGSLTATGGASAAGIGGSYYGGSVTAGGIIITNGTITATGGVNGAGIGGGVGGAGGTITINGGTNLFNLSAAPDLGGYTYDSDTAHTSAVTATFPTELEITEVTADPITAINTFSGNTVTFAGKYNHDNITLTITGTLADGRIPVKFTTAAFAVNVDSPLPTTTITVTPPDNITYGGTLGNPTAEAAAGDVGTFTFRYTGTMANDDTYDSDEKPTLPGEYTVTATLVSDTHQGSGTATFTISPLRLTWDKSGTVYDRQYNGTGTGNATVATLPTLSGIINNDNVTVTLGTIAFDNASVGTRGVSSRNSGIGGSDAWKYYPPWLQPTFEDATINPSYFTPVKGTHYTVSELNSEGWANGGFVITAITGLSGSEHFYEISKDGINWSGSASITFSDDTDNGSAEFYLRHRTNFNLSAMATETYKLDTTPPTAEVKYRTNGFTAFLNTVTFGLFFKDTVEVEIQGADNLSGVAEIEYIKSGAAITDFDNVTWTTGTSFNVSAREKFFLYVRVTDNAGNVSQIYYDSVVVFNESEDASGEYTYASGDSLTIENIVMNGNTVKSISGNSITSDDYTSEPCKITFTSAFMATLLYGTDHAPEDYTFIVEWNPMGETWVSGTNNDTPGTTIITITVISPCGSSHDFQNYTSDGNATCEVDGTETGTCTRCGETGGTRTEVDSALGHDMPTAYTTDSPADCTNAAVETRTCQRDDCDHTETNQNPASALGHVLDNWEPDEGVCGEPGTEREICTRCGTELNTRTTDELLCNFDWDNAEVTDEPTCLLEGLKTATCTRCGAGTDTRTVDALDHNFIDNWETTLEPTCIADGIRERSCTRDCGETGDTETEDITTRPDHSYTVFVSATATCTDDGDDTFECSTDGCTATTTVSRTALGHDLPEDWTERDAPTCEDDGLEYKACRRGGCTHEETQDIEALGHSFTNYTGDTATCTTGGTETATCDRNGCNETDERATSALGHTPKAANCTECSVCDETGMTRTCTTSSPCAFHAGTPNNDPTNPPNNDPTTPPNTDPTTPPNTDPTTPPNTDPTTPPNTDPTTPPNTNPTTPETTPIEYIDDEIIIEALETENPVIDLSETDSTVISAEMIQEIADSGKDITVVLENGYTFTILADSISPDAGAFDLNIDIYLTSQAEVIDGVKIPANSIVINPNFTGEFGFDVKITFTAEQLREKGINGNNVKLFHIDHDGKVTDMGKVKLNADGSVEFIISHASYYVLAEEAPESAESTETTPTGNERTTGDETNPYTAVTISLGATILAGGAAILSRKTKKRKEKITD